jgi:hypothetical protein
MPQDAVSGARANEYGRECARLVAEKLGAVAVSRASNEFALDGHLITIRCAHNKTTKVGATYRMLDRVDAVVAAMETKDGSYDLYELSPSLYRMHMTDSKGEGRVGLVTCSIFRKPEGLTS